MKISPVIHPTELKSLKQDIVLIDARSGPSAKANYATMHLKGARYVDLETELSGPKDNPAQGGRHPLPDISKFAQVLGHLGITPDTRVIVYDDKNGANAAARFWWMLRAAGHEQVQVLDGGIQAAIAEELQVSSSEEIVPVQPDYPVTNWLLPIVDINTVEKAAQNPAFTVIDVRETKRYRGETEPIDLVAGHIPGAINIPYSKNLDENGFFLQPDTLRKEYLSSLEGHTAEKVIVHCGSGVTACHTILAMDQAGLDIPALYVGSWSEWSRTERPIATTTTEKSQ